MMSMPARLRARNAEWSLWALAMLAAVCTFSLWPELDLVISAQFYTPTIDPPFAMKNWLGVDALYRAVPWLGRLVLATSALLVTIAYWRPQWLTPRWRRRGKAMLLVALLGGVLLVNVGLKEHWGRPRPTATTHFGGAKPFQPALQPSALCRSNCSFVSGHAATGFCLLALGLTGAPALRRRWLLAGWVLGGTFGMGRIVQGGHFASDVIFCGLFIWGCALAVREVWLRLRVAQRGATRRSTGCPGMVHGGLSLRQSDSH